ncbi:MAG: energy-coupling factor ABC transporter ATP-binding protein [Methanotrichaceae archaeon]|nr:energy-coupling factor ABC transporter ATP-binding protein [Methanotrichaceae archaeon]
MLKIEDLSVSYPSREWSVFNALSFELPPGSICLITGGSESGKTTLCLAMAGLLNHARPDAVMQGRILWNGETISQEHYNKDVAISLEQPYSQITGIKQSVMEEMAFGLEMMGLPRDAMRTKIAQATAIFGLTGLLRQSPKTLSGGETQRLVLASSYVLDPRLWILDRPLTEIDPMGRETILREIALLAKEKGMIAVIAEEPRPDLLALVTHHLDLDHAAFKILDRDNIILKHNAAVLPSHIQLTNSSITPIATNNSLRLQGITFRYPTAEAKVVKDFYLDAKSGDCVWITGPNGSGKTTIAKLILGLLKLQEGSIRINDTDMTGKPLWERARSVAYAFQNPDLQIFSTTVRDEVVFGPRNLGFSNENCSTLTETYLRLFGLTDKKEFHPHDLNLSERKRLGLASAFAMDSPILILDEPSQYQNENQKKMIAIAMIDALKKGKIILCITNSPDFKYLFVATGS